jgi:hypothetical protein
VYGTRLITEVCASPCVEKVFQNQTQITVTYRRMQSDMVAGTLYFLHFYVT